MKIEFDEKGYEYIEFQESPNGVYIVISAPGADDPRKTVVNSAELTKEQLLELISDIFELEK
jgi:hypothetical protein